jgi:hypothetical protein
MTPPSESTPIPDPRVGAAEAHLHNALLEINLDWSDWDEEAALKRVLQIAEDALKGRPDYPLEAAGAVQPEGDRARLIDGAWYVPARDLQKALDLIEPALPYLRATLGRYTQGKALCDDFEKLLAEHGRLYSEFGKRLLWWRRLS